MNDNGEIDSARCRTEMSETCMMVAGEGKRSRTREGRKGQGIYYLVFEGWRGDTESLLRISKCFPQREIRS